MAGIFGEDFNANVYDYSDLLVQASVVTTSTLSPEMELKVEQVAGDDGGFSEVKAYFREQIDILANKWITIILTFAGNIKYRAKGEGVGSEEVIVPVTSCPCFVGMGMRPYSEQVFVPMKSNMLIPMMCLLKRGSAGGEQPPIEKGFINSLLFSFNRPHPDYLKDREVQHKKSGGSSRAGVVVNNPKFNMTTTPKYNA